MGGRIVAYGSYIPVHRLQRAELGDGKGTRSVASYDEDTTSLGIEAARRALQARPGDAPGWLAFTTTAPAYADRTNATAIHAAMQLPTSASAYDMVGSVRSWVGALSAASDAAMGRTALVVASDIRTGLPGSADESEGGDAAVAFVLADDDRFLAEVESHGVATAEFLDRWRVPGEIASKVWEERFVETAMVPLAQAALADALTAADVGLDDIDQIIVTGTSSRSVASVRRVLAPFAQKLTDDRGSVIGNSGAAHAGLLLADALERAQPAQRIVLLVLADGAECLVLRTGPLAGEFRPVQRVDEQLDGLPVTRDDALVWRGLLRREPPRRPDPDRPAAPPAFRNVSWKFAFVAGRCATCGTRHLPAERVCLDCGSIDQMQPESLAGLHGQITTFAVDHLAFSVAPPVVVAVVDFDGGGRIQCELTDVDPSSIAVGDRVELTFRRLYTTADGVHDYFWKVRPVRNRHSEVH